MKKWVAILLCVAMAFTTAIADVVDHADLFSAQEVEVMNSLIRHVSDLYQAEVVILTTRDIPRTFDDNTIESFADTYYEENGYGVGEDRNGMLLLIDMNNSYLYISTAGMLIDVLTDTRIDSLLDEIIAYYKISFGTGCISLLHHLCIDLQLEVQNGQYRYTVEN